MGNAASEGNVLGDDGAAEAVLSVVGEMDGILNIGVGADGEDGAEDLLLPDGHLGGDVGEDGGGNKVALSVGGDATNSDLGT